MNNKSYDRITERIVSLLIPLSFYQSGKSADQKRRQNPSCNDMNPEIKAKRATGGMPVIRHP